jgi:integrase
MSFDKEMAVRGQPDRLPNGSSVHIWVLDIELAGRISPNDHSHSGRPAGRDEIRPRRFLLASPNDTKRPIDGHALSVAMIRFGNALSAVASASSSGTDEVRAIETWISDRPSAHDLRRTLATRLAGSGIPAEDVSACLNHTRTTVTARHYDLYDRAREKRRALELWSEQVAKIVGASGQTGEGRSRRPAQTPATVPE